MDIRHHPIVSRDDWIAARKRHLAQEKELTHLRDRISAERRALPWVKVDKAYLFQTDEGERTLAQLFGANSELMVYHFMLAPGETQGCVGCSLLADHLEGAAPHLEHHDVSVVLVSRATLPEIRRYQARMGWQLQWVSSHGSDFNHDFHVSFTPEEVASGKVEYNYQTIEPWGEDAHGISVFYKDEKGDVFHTYSSYGRGCETLLGTYAVLDMMPKGRDEGDGSGNLTRWVKRHDEYGVAPQSTASCCS